MRAFCLAAVVILPVVLSAVDTAAQLPAGTVYADCTFVAGGNSIFGHNAIGLVTTIIPLKSGKSPDAIDMNVTNDGLLVWDTTGVHTYDFILGTQAFKALAGSSIVWGCVDEDAGMVWAEAPNTLYRSRDTSGSGTRVLFNSTSSGQYNAVCWNGSTGGYVACKYGSGSSYSVDFIARDGSRTRTAAGVPYMSACDWSPWTGDIIISYMNGGLLRLDQNGAAITFAAQAKALQSANGVEAMHQNKVNAEMVVVVTCCGIPAYLSTVTGMGVITTLHTGIFGPSDVELVGSRNLWAMGPWKVGTRCNLNLNMGRGSANDYYQVALSFSFKPGLSLGAVHLHLTPDDLFFMSARGSLPGLFNHFSGVLDVNGLPAVRPSVDLPNLPALRGVRVYGGAVTYGKKGITAASNCWGITIG